MTVGIILASFVLMFLGLILLVLGALTETAAIYLWGQCVAMITGVNGSYLAACHYGDKKKGHQDAGVDSR